ncbi:MAG: HEAT repeat domain-containing protein [Polyangiales bacterium]
MTMWHDDAIAKARQLMRQGQAGPAIGLLMHNANESAHLPPREYDELLKLLADALQMEGRFRAAASIWLYLKDARRMAALVPQEPRDLARAAWLERQYQTAAQYYRAARWPAHAAIAFERAAEDARQMRRDDVAQQQLRAAQALWEEVSGDPRLREDPYTAALVSFNLGRVHAALGADDVAHKCRVRATRLLEEAADVLEARGLRERAFDCFQVLLTLGAQTRSFENLAEGYLNCIRILREDHLKYYAFQYYEDFIKRSDEAREHHATATILHEAADYARTLDMPFHAMLRVREAEAWRRSADHMLAAGGAAELAENALLAAVSALTTVGMHARAVAVFGQLAAMPGMDEKRVRRYRQLSERYAEARDEPTSSEALPDFLKKPVQYPEIWNVDVIEWEEAGDAVEACGEVLLDVVQPDFIRRKALRVRLIPLTQNEPNHPNTLGDVATQLGQVQLYAVLSPLEHLFERGPSAVRVQVLRASRNLFFKRTFGIVMKGVTDPDPHVRAAAVEAIGALHFPHAFDPLSRLHRDSTDPSVRFAALSSIGRIPSLEAVEYLIGTLVHGAEEERRLAEELLVRTDAAEASMALQSAAVREGVELQQRMAAVLRKRHAR